MATVTDTAITLVDALDSSTVTNVPSGGGGAQQNLDLFLQGTASYAKRLSNVTDTGFAVDVTTGQNLTGLHVGVWVFYVHYSALTAMKGILCTDTSNFGRFNVFDNSGNFNYPTLGGWARLWVDADKTPDSEGGTGYSKTSVRYFGFQVSAPAVGSGNAANAFLDAVHKTNSSTGGLLLTGTAGLWDDFLANDERAGGTNGGRFGIVSSSGGVIYCQGRLKLGSASSLAFSDSGFSIVFPNQQACSSTFMGISVDLQHASTAITWTSGALSSPGVTTKGDLIVTGSTGAFTASGMSLSGIRVVTLTSACSMTSSSFVNCGQLTAPGSTLNGTKVITSTVAADVSAMVWDVNTDTDGKLDNMTFSKGTNAHHAIELGASTPTSITLNGWTVTGFNAADGNNDSVILNTSGKSITVNVSGSSGTISFKNSGGGSATTIVADSVSATVTVKDTANPPQPILNANVMVRADAGGPFPADVPVTISNSATEATVTHSVHGLATNDKILFNGASLWQNNGVFSITVVDANSYTYTLPEDPGGSPTGSTEATFAVLSGLTNSLGVLTMTRVFASNQPISGRVRKSTSSPFYKTGPVSGEVNTSIGFATTIQLISDE